MIEAPTFKLTISKVHELLFTGEAKSVILPGTEGELMILPKHEPLITLLKRGTITVKSKDGTTKYLIQKGLCETSQGQVTILV
jgi:F-type H+-transporting ATPase subunit epsilon